LALVVALAGAFTVEAALASKGGTGRGGSGRGARSGAHHGGKHHAGARHGHFHSGAAIGAAVVPAYWPWWNYAPYYPALATAPAPPIEYIERADEEAQREQFWLYCGRTQSYFPYVVECADGWQRVPTTPPNAKDEG
jgi:hypothetical protein